MLEFALIMPFFFIFMAFIVDVSRVMIIQNTAQDAAFAAARAGAQIGGGTTQATDAGIRAADFAFNDSLGARTGWITASSLSIVETCDTSPNLNFTVTVDYGIQTLFASLAGLDQYISLQTSGVSRCEIVR
jgi:Flp pilus assembly protein TadG